MVVASQKLKGKRKANPLRQTEAQFLAAVIEYAELHGWACAHFRPARTKRGWRTAVQGRLGAGFPDLLFAHPLDCRIIFAELKRDGATVTANQERVVETLRRAGATVRVWAPLDWPDIEHMLRRR
jgi:hypothetical protein